MSEHGGRVIHRSHWKGIAIVVMEEGGRRTLHFGSHLQQSAMALEDPDALILNYTRQMMSALLFHPAPRQVALIGLGGGSMVRFLMRHVPEVRLEVVELSPRVVDAARQCFFLPEDPRLQVLVGDGAAYLAGEVKKHQDLLLVDAFDDKGMASSVRAGLFFHHARLRLARGGVMALNMTCGKNPARCRALTDAMGVLFQGELLRFTVEGTNNHILFGLRERMTPEGWLAAGARAHTWENMTGIPFGVFLNRLGLENAPYLRSRGIHP